MSGHGIERGDGKDSNFDGDTEGGDHDDEDATVPDCQFDGGGSSGGDRSGNEAAASASSSSSSGDDETICSTSVSGPAYSGSQTQRHSPRIRSMVQPRRQSTAIDLTLLRRLHVDQVQTLAPRRSDRLADHKDVLISAPGKLDGRIDVVIVTAPLVRCCVEHPSASAD